MEDNEQRIGGSEGGREGRREGERRESGIAEEAWKEDVNKLEIFAWCFVVW